MANRYPPFPDVVSIGQMYGPAMKIRTREEAQDYFERLVEWTVKHEGLAREEAEKTEIRNLANYAGNFNPTTAYRVLKLFWGAHPLFGVVGPTAKEAFEAGRRLLREFNN